MLAACQPGTKLDLNILAFPINFHIMQPHPFRWDAGPVAWRNADSEWDSSVASHSSPTQAHTSMWIERQAHTTTHAQSFMQQSVLTSFPHVRLPA